MEKKRARGRSEEERRQRSGTSRPLLPVDAAEVKADGRANEPRERARRRTHVVSSRASRYNGATS